MPPAKTTLITGGGKTERRTKAQELVTEILKEETHRYDIFAIDSEALLVAEDKRSVGIENSRELIKFLREKPLQHQHKVGLILEAEYLTPEAQNALLKTLEEPPASAFLILTAPKRESMLPTIVSRCRVVRLAAATSSPAITLATSKSDLLDWVAENKELLEDKGALLKTLAGWESGWRQQLLAGGRTTNTIEHLCELRQTLQTTNVNTRLALEEFLLKCL